MEKFKPLLWRAREVWRGGWAAPAPLRYGVAVVSLGLALLARLAADPYLKDVQPFPSFYLAVCLVAWWAGWGPALLVLTSGYFLADWFFVTPRGSLGVHGFVEWLHLLAYVFVSGTTIFIIHRMRTIERRVRTALGQRELELKQAERLAQLGNWTWVPGTGAATWSEQLYRIAARDPRLPAPPHQEHLQLYMSPGRERLQEAVEKALKTGESYELDLQLLCGNGSSKWVTARGEAIHLPKGGILGLRGTVQDITERKQMEQALRQALEDLQHVSYSIMHDMRAPLRAMQGFTAILEEDCGACPLKQSREYHRKIMLAAQRMDHLIRDALGYTDAMSQELPLGRVELLPLLRGLIETYPNLAPFSAEIQVPADLPAVMGNETALAQCFSNLLGNAVKFVVPGTKPSVRVRAETGEGTARIWVEDQGIGIAPHVQQRLFGMFQRHNLQYEGTGIGLAIVRKTVTRMGGKVGVESEVGKGSRFWIELPTAGPEAQTLPRQSQSKPPVRGLLGVATDDRVNRM